MQEFIEAERRPVIVGLALRNSVEAEGMGLTEHERKIFYEVMSMVGELVRQE